MAGEDLTYQAPESLPAVVQTALQLLGRDVRNVLGDTLVPRCQELASTPFQLEFQFDVDERGCASATFGASLRFAAPPGDHKAARLYYRESSEKKSGRRPDFSGAPPACDQ